MKTEAEQELVPVRVSHHTMYLYVDAASVAGKGIGIMDFVVVGVVVGWMGILSR